MPNRILRDGILTSERVNALSWEAEVFYRRLMSAIDDFGRFHAQPKLLRAACFPLKIDQVTDDHINDWLALCERAGLIRVYVAADGKRYLEVLNFHQQVRAKASKFPNPPDSCAADAEQVHSTREAPAPVFVFGDGDGVEDESHSAADASGGQRPPCSPDDGRNADAKAEVFAAGVSLLVAAGAKESSARSFLGAQARDHGSDAVAEAVRSCQHARPVDPKSWIDGRLGPKLPKGTPRCPVDDVVDAYTNLLPGLPAPVITDELRRALDQRWRWLFTEPRGRGQGPRATSTPDALAWFRRLFEATGRTSSIVDPSRRPKGLIAGLPYLVSDAGVQRINAEAEAVSTVAEVTT